MMILRKGNENVLLVLILLAVLGIMAGIGASKVPSPWFDEGWTLIVAKNWVQQGLYAIDIVDQWVSAAPMTHSFTVTIPVAASFRLLGVGVLQGRLPSILYTVGTLAFLFTLAKQMYGLKTAWVTLVVLLFAAPLVSLNPLLYGRQVLGETPMLFFLLIGYWFFAQVLRGSRISPLIVALFWGLALISKRQILPFWLAAMLFSLAVALLRREWKIAKLLITLTIGVLSATVVFMFVESRLVGDIPSNGQFSLEGLYSLATWTWAPGIRLAVLLMILRFGVFFMFGLITSSHDMFQRLRQPGGVPPIVWCELSLIVLTGSWFVWYTFGSLGWPKYYYPVFVLSAVFFAKFLTDWTAGFTQFPTPKLLQNNRLKFRKTLVAFSIIALNLGFVALSIEYIAVEAQTGVYEVSEFFIQEAEPDALVETYDSELHFLLDQPVHYPPDQLQIDLNRRRFLKQTVSISYNPLDVNPDYLVIGPRSKDWELYEPLVQSGEFQAIKEFPGYQIYKRVP